MCMRYMKTPHHFTYRSHTPVAVVSMGWVLKPAGTTGEDKCQLSNLEGWVCEEIKQLTNSSRQKNKIGSMCVARKWEVLGSIHSNKKRKGRGESLFWTRNKPGGGGGVIRRKRERKRDRRRREERKHTRAVLQIDLKRNIFYIYIKE